MRKPFEIVFAVLAAATLGCAGEGIPVYLPGAHDTPDNYALVVEAAAILGQSVEWSDRQYGAVRISIIQPEDGSLCGEEMIPTLPCRRSLWSCPDPALLAHEIGHQLNLPHVNHGLMAWWVDVEGDPDLRLSDGQYRKIDRQAALLRACR